MRLCAREDRAVLKRKAFPVIVIPLRLRNTVVKKNLDHPGLVVAEPIGSLAHLGLGRAYAMGGDSAKARTGYQDFLALWKDADPDIPILKQAKAEYAKLQ